MSHQLGSHFTPPSAFRRESTNQGFVLPGAIGLILIFITIGFIFFGVTKLQIADSKNLHQCRMHLIKAQEHALQTINDVINLNEQVLKLRFQMKLAKAEALAAAASGNGPALADAQRRILIIGSQQLALGSRQQALIAKGKLMMKIEIHLISDIQQSEDSLFGVGRHSVTQLILPEPKIAISPADFGQSPPTYKIDSPIEEFQYLQAVWQSAFHHLDSGGTKWFPKKTSQMLGCAATAKELGSGLTVQLTRVKSLSRQLFF